MDRDDFEQLHQSRFFVDVEDYWPQRLLHIPSMTSIPRTGSYTYGSAERPSYSILSYTWGRWEIRDSDTGCQTMKPASLPVRGVPWKIPRIAESHFAVTTFQKVVDEMHRLGGTEWAWIDIACIDQEDVPTKMEEVGHQASIFAKASEAFVWLSHTAGTVLDEACLLLVRCNVPELFGEERLVPSSEDEEMDCGRIIRTLQSVRSAVAPLLSDPWFSSLWTLQEFMLRGDAIILDREGVSQILSRDPMPEVPRTRIRMRMMNQLGIFRRALLGLIERIKGMHQETEAGRQMYELASHISARIQQTGFSEEGMATSTTDNPNVQYSAARFRQTVHREDRIYAISQIYNVRVGNSLRPHDFAPSFDALVQEFGLAINSQSPVGQLFVHTSPSTGARSWCITENCEIPGLLRQIRAEHYRSRSSIAADESGSVIAEGVCCQFSDFYGARRDSWMDVDANIFLDRETEQLVDPHNELSSSSVDEYGARMEEHFKTEDMLIMRLGETKGVMPGMGGQATILNTPEGQRCFGVILKKAQSVSEYSTLASYKRIGVCEWTCLRTSEWGTDDIEKFISEFHPDLDPEHPIIDHIWRRYQYAQDVSRMFSSNRRVRLV